MPNSVDAISRAKNEKLFNLNIIIIRHIAYTVLLNELKHCMARVVYLRSNVINHWTKEWIPWATMATLCWRKRRKWSIINNSFATREQTFYYLLFTGPYHQTGVSNIQYGIENDQRKKKTKTICHRFVMYNNSFSAFNRA